MKKFIAGIVGIAMATSMIASVGTAGAASYAFNSDLTIGSTGPDVVALQTILESAGYLVMPVGVSKGYFGGLTQAAVAKWQAAVGISPTAGYFGPKSRAYINGSMPSTPAAGTPGCPAGAMYNFMTGAPCTGGSMSPTPTPSNGSLEGDNGEISDVNTLSQYNNEDVGEGESDVKIAGFELEASTDGDIALKSIKVILDPAGNGSGDSDHLEDYIDSLSIWQGSTKIGSADADEFSENDDDTYSKSISVKNAVVRADEKEKFYISIDAAGNLDSGDIDSDSWTVAVENIRFEDGSGVVTTDDSTGDLGDDGASIGTDGGTDGDGVPFDFVTFATAADTELKISTASDTPEAGIVVIDDTDNTDDVVLLKGKLKLEGESSVNIDEFPVTFTGSGSGVATTTGSVKLTLGGEEYTETVSYSSGSSFVTSVTFDDLNFDIDAEDTVEFTVSADINDVDAASGFDEGDSLRADVTASNRALIDVENEEGDQLSESEKSGTATGEAQEFRTNGIALTLVSTNTSVAAGNSTNDDQGTFTIKFKVTAVGDTVYISTLADATLTGVTDGKTSIHVDRAGTATVGGVSVAISNITDTDLNAAGLFQIDEGDSETFELTTTVQLPTAGLAGLYRAVLGGVRWTTDGTDSTPSNTYTSNLDEFKTSYIGLN